MKKVWLIAIFCCLLSGCANDSIKESISVNVPLTGIIVRASTAQTTINEGREPIVFTGNDMLWFNETTKEIRFKDNAAMLKVISNVTFLKFYLDNNFLFSAIAYVKSQNDAVYDNMVFHYNTVENKYYLLDGFPPNIVREPGIDISDPPASYLPTIAAQWQIFIDKLKQDGKYQN